MIFTIKVLWKMARKKALVEKLQSKMNTMKVNIKMISMMVLVD